MTLSNRIQSLQAQIPPTVRLIAVSKTFPSQQLREAYHAGIRDFGESRLQEALPKQLELADLPDICWHFIGRLQSNKSRKVLENFSWLHSVHSWELLQRLDNLAADLPTKPNICLQVKMLADEDKQGWSAKELESHLPQLEVCQHLNIQGLMTILPLGLDRDRHLAAFEAVRELAKSLREQSSLSFQELSMGMSGDYLEAISAGATMIRVGRSLFGDR